MNLNEMTVLVTGANRGIGRALATRLAAAGTICILTVRNAADVTGLRRDFAFAQQRVHVEACDISRPSDVQALATRVAAYTPRLDALVNNAGVFPAADRRMHPSNVGIDVMRATFEVNLFGTIAMCQSFVPLLVRGSRIINVSSTMGQFGTDGVPPYATAYCVSKTALNAYTSALANEVGERGIMVDALHPGWVQTEMGGADAQITPDAATETIIYLATRSSGETGKFWFEKRVLPW